MASSIWLLLPSTLLLASCANAQTTTTSAPDLAFYGLHVPPPPPLSQAPEVKAVRTRRNAKSNSISLQVFLDRPGASTFAIVPEVDSSTNGVLEACDTDGAVLP